MPPSTTPTHKEGNYIVIDDLPPLNEPDCSFSDPSSQKIAGKNTTSYDPLGVKEHNQSPTKPT